MCAGDLGALAGGAEQYCKEGSSLEITFGAEGPGVYGSLARGREKKRQGHLRRRLDSGAFRRVEALAAPGRRPAEARGGRSGGPPQRPSCVSPKSAREDLRLVTQLALESAPAPPERGRSPGAAGGRSRDGPARRGAPPGLPPRVRGRAAEDGGARASASEPPAGRGTPDSRQDGQDDMPRSQSYPGWTSQRCPIPVDEAPVKNVFIHFDCDDFDVRGSGARCSSAPARCSSEPARAAENASPRDRIPPAEERSLEASSIAGAPPRPSAPAAGQQPSAGAVSAGASSTASTLPRPSAAAAAGPPPLAPPRAQAQRPRIWRPAASGGSPSPLPRLCGPQPLAGAAAVAPPLERRAAGSSAEPFSCPFFQSGSCKFGDRCRNRDYHILKEGAAPQGLQNLAGREVGVESGKYVCSISICSADRQCRECKNLQDHGSGKGLGKGSWRGGLACRECGKDGHWGNECKATEEERRRHRAAAQHERAIGR